MVAAMFIHTFLNFFLNVYATVVSKAAGVVPAVYSIETFVGKIVHSIVALFRKL
jgi:hypothetical protein